MTKLCEHYPDGWQRCEKPATVTVETANGTSLVAACSSHDHQVLDVARRRSLLMTGASDEVQIVIRATA